MKVMKSYLDRFNIWKKRFCSEREHPNNKKKATLCHEIIHGLDDMYCIGLKEKQVEKLGNALYMLILDNSEMFGEG